jgi:hypothetical protein
MVIDGRTAHNVSCVLFGHMMRASFKAASAKRRCISLCFAPFNAPYASRSDANCDFVGK